MSRRIALISTVRLESTRFPNKMIREFSDGVTMCDTLFKLMIEAAVRYPFHSVNVAIHPGEVDVVNKVIERGLCPIFRSKQSASSDKLEHIFDFISEIEAEYIMWLNGSVQFVSPDMVALAASTFAEDESIVSLTSVAKRSNWFWDSHGKEICPPPSSGKTQDSKYILEAIHAFHIFPKERMLKEGRYWSGGHNDPALFISEDSVVDVDHEVDFIVADAIRRNIA